MIAHIKGILEEINIDHVVIDVNGVGFNVFITGVDYNDLSVMTGEVVKLYTYTAVREDAFLLYGFTNKESLFLFKKLITVNGLGPKGAMSILSSFDTDTLRIAILSADVKLLSSASGVGKKTAERIILDLKDKLNWDNDLINKEITTNIISKNSSTISPVKKEAVEALIALGYNPKDANNAVINLDIDDSVSVEDVLKMALNNLI